MDQSAPDINAVKSKMAGMWANGDFGVIAKTLMPAAEDFVGSLNIPIGAKVLDVACGSGNLALVAAGKGADAKGLDIVEDLIRQSKERAELANLNIEFTVGDAEALPYADNEFDYVITMFGAMFCPRPDVTTKELFRVCKPGGIVAMANWIPNEFAEDFFGTIRKFAPPPPPGIPPPNDWGVEDIVRERFGSLAKEIKFTHKTTELYYDAPPSGVTEYFVKYFGPIKTLYDNMNDETREVFTGTITDVFTKYNISKEPNTNITLGEYLEVIAVKA